MTLVTRSVNITPYRKTYQRIDKKYSLHIKLMPNFRCGALNGIGACYSFIVLNIINWHIILIYFSINLYTNH